MGTKISLIGAGNIGGTIALLTAIKNLGDVVLVDIAKGVAKGKALDISHSLPVLQCNRKITGTTSLKQIKDSEVIVVTAGVPRKAGMSRDDLVEINLKVMKDVGRAIKKYSPKSFVIVVTNPLDVMTWALQKITGIPHSHVVGMAGVLDTSRFKFHLAEALGFSVQDVSSSVLGGHGDDMVALLRHTTISGIPLEDMIKMKKITRQKVNEIVKRIRTCGGEIITYMGTSAYYSPAASAVEMVECYLRDQKKIIPCSAYLRGQYGVKGIYVGVPVVLGANGAEKIVEINLKKDEKKEFIKSVNSVSDVLKVAKKLI
ncbi:MAG: malate dehydrogenase [Alphaproteobacteria bacterium MarineAlpha6_Bin4]|nr:MAG: malate dehydrogenase [Alphaproteobacteria bacterium MarineAlpha6_Bin4]|tara:strand:+ start:12024 stop:12968 length:945 start_codon:yes stop_codon:yes gene_type:complete